MAAHGLSFLLGFHLPSDATGFGEEAVDLMWEAHHVAASFLRDVGEVLVDDLRKFVSFLLLPRASVYTVRTPPSLLR